jgi:hypothetical protein
LQFVEDPQSKIRNLKSEIRIQTVALSMTIRILGSAPVSGAGDGVLTITNFLPRSFTAEIAEITKSEQDFLSVLRVLRG